MVRLSSPQRSAQPGPMPARFMPCHPRLWNGATQTLALFFLVFSGWVSLSAQVPSPLRPNIVLINVDDLDVPLWEAGRGMGALPNLDRLAKEGISFSNCHVTSPLCGPSRASLFTGCYVSRHGIRTQSPDTLNSNGYNGGYSYYRTSDPLNPNSINKPNWTTRDLPVWLKQAGYHTMLVGKYLHEGFTPAPGQPWASIRPSGWDDFYCSFGNRYVDTSRYLSRRGDEYLELNNNTGNLRLNDYPPEFRNLLVSGYRTNIEAVDAAMLIQDHVDARPNEPFFLYFAPFAPHLPKLGESMVDTRYQNWWRQLKQPKGRDFDPWFLLNKPNAVANLPRLSAADIAESDAVYRERLLAMKSLDDMIGLLRQRLSALGILDQTLIIFTSDNGYMLGQQRHSGKQLPYDRCTQVPFVVWGTNLGVASGVTRDHLLSHVDIAPTLLELAGAPSPAVDGVSFTSLLPPQISIDSPSWRPSGVLSEHFERIAPLFKDQEGVYLSLRLHDQRYTRWADGFTEHYDLTNDRLELNNSRNSLSTAEQNLFDLLVTQFREPGIEFAGSIATPFVEGQEFLRQVDLEGIAEAPQGIKEVRLVLRRVVGPRAEFFDGNRWVQNFVQLPADLDAPGKSLSRWHYNFRPNQTGRYPVQLSARIYANNGNYQRTIFQRSFTIENDIPATAITVPNATTSTADRSKPLTLEGWGKTDGPLREVRLVIRDSNSDLYFDGNHWRSGFRFVYAALNFPVDPSYALWTYELPADEQSRNLTISARSFHTNGQFDQTVPVVRIDRR